MADQEEDLLPTQTPGYNPGEKKTLEEYSKLDENDESLKKWKESLGIGKSAGPADDPRQVIVLNLALEVKDRSDVVLDLSNFDKHNKLTHHPPFIIKEGVEYRMKVKFIIQHDLVCGLKYLQVVKRKGITVDKTEEMIGSYGPAGEPYEKKFLPEEAPSGMLARGHYDVKSKFVDDDGKVHMEWTWSFDIKKDWKD